MFLILDKDWNIHYVSPELLSKLEMTDQIIEDIQKLIHPDDVHHLKRQNFNILSDKSRMEVTIRMKCKRGQWTKALIKILPLLNHLDKFEMIFMDVILDVHSPPNLKSTYDNVNVFLWSLDNTTGKCSILGNCKDMFGYTEEDFEENPFVWKKVIHSDDLIKLNQIEKEACLNQVVTDEIRILHPNGKVKRIQLRVIPTLDDLGYIKRIDAVCIDITSQNETRKETKDINSNCGNLLLLVVDRDADIIDIYSTVKISCSQKSLLRKSLLTFIDKAEKEKLYRKLEEAFSGNTQNLIANYSNELGIIYRLNIMLCPISLNGEIRFVICLMEYKNMYRETKSRLCDTEKKLTKLLNKSNVGIWHADVVNNRLIISKGMEKIIGHSSKEIYINQNIFEKIIPGKDLEIIRRNASRLMLGIPIILKHSVMTNSGEVLSLENRLIPTLNSQGNLIVIEGIVTDLPSYKEVENILRVDITAITSENSNMAHAKLAPNGHFKSVSPSFAELLNYSEQELLSLKITDLIQPNQNQCVSFIINKLLSGGDIKNELITMIRKDGKPLYSNVVCLPILINNSINGLFFIIKDLTKQLNLEKKLLLSKETFYQKYDKFDIGILISEYNQEPLRSRIIEANKYVYDLLNYSYSEILNKSIDDFAVPHHSPTKNILTNDSEYTHFRTVFLTKDGQKLPVFLYNHLTNWQEQKVIFTIIKTTDILPEVIDEFNDPGQRLRIIMAEMNINTGELADLTNLTAATISNIRTGKVKKPNIETARKIAEALGVNISTLWPDINY